MSSLPSNGNHLLFLKWVSTATTAHFDVASVSKFVNLSNAFSILQNAIKNILESSWIIFLYYCRPSGWLYSPARMRNSSYKKSHKFRRLLLCSILYFDLMEFSENRDKEFQLGPMLFQTC